MSQTNKSDNHNVDITARYERAQRLQAGIGTKNVAFNTTLFPHWIGDSDTFWYTRETQNGQVYRRVDAKTGSNMAAFDHDTLALTLAAASGEEVAADNLPLSDIDLTVPDRVTFSAFGKCWIYKCSNETCEEITAQPSDLKVSPDGKQAVFVRDYNLWVKNLVTGEEKALTQDGERFNEYATHQPMSVYGLQGPSASLEAIWSPDSQRIFTLVIDIRAVEIAPPLVQQVPRDGSLRPKVLQADRRQAFPGDEHIEAYQFLAIEVKSGHIQRVDHPPCPVMYPPYSGYFTGGRGWWDGDSRHAYFVDQECGGQVLNVVKLDTHTGHTQLLFQETSDSTVTLIPISHINALLMPLPASNELIWFSERDGWGHLYLYEMATGRLKNPITQGNWLVRNVLHFDEKNRELFIQTAGREEGRNPYYCDICRVNIDTGKITTILSTDHHYMVCDQRSRFSVGDQSAAGVSPSAQHIVTTRSRVDEAPVSLLLNQDGSEVVTLEAADVSALPDNWQWPEPVMLKAADGHTDIDAVVFRPSDFDPNLSYPVIDASYAYVDPIGSFDNNNAGSRMYLSGAAYAELGFIVVMINNRGNDGLRDTAFSHYQNPDASVDPLLLRKYFKDDCIAGIQQLAERYPYMDLNRVGVVEFCSIPLALAGLLHHPDFYKVGVSVCAMADTRMVGAFSRHKDNWLQFEDVAENLQGKLLIIAGMLDWAIPQATTFRLVEALQKANKRFDMLLLPNLPHGHNNYTVQRSWDYVVEHLLGIEPPADFKLVSAVVDAYREAELSQLEMEQSS